MRLNGKEQEVWAGFGEALDHLLYDRSPDDALKIWSQGLSGSELETAISLFARLLEKNTDSEIKGHLNRVLHLTSFASSDARKITEYALAVLKKAEENR